MASKQPVDTAPDTMDDLLYVKRSVGGKTKYCGYRREYLAQNLTEFEKEISICNVCEGIMRKASIVKGETTCQLCSETPNELNAVKLVENCVNKLEIKCPLLRDCKWKGKLSEAENHLKECKRFLVECIYCEQVLIRGDMEIHEQNVCPFREIGCEFCEKKGCAMYYTLHLKYCYNYPVTCSNGCGKEFPRRLLSDHNAECPLAEIECPYTKYGCKAKPMRRDLLSHKKEFIIEHVDMVETKNQELEVVISALKVEVQSLKSELNTVKRLDGVEWKLRDVNKLIDGKTLESVCFYVNKYKLKCISKFVCYGIGSRLDFSIQRVVGDFDAILGVAYITECRIILQKSDGTQSCYNRDITNYQLKIATTSDVFYSLYKWDYSSFLTPDNSLTFLLYFDVNSDALRRLPRSLPQCYATEVENPDPFRVPLSSLDGADEIVYSSNDET